MEYKVEMLCKDLNVEGAIKALRLVHPYEEPAFDVVKLYSGGSRKMFDFTFYNPVKIFLEKDR